MSTADIECGAEQAHDEDDRAHLARREAHVGHAAAGAEAEALRLGARVADHERGGHRRGREGRAVDVVEAQEADDEAHVDDRLARAVEDRVEERAELAALAGRAGQRAIEHVERGAKADDQAGRDPQLDGRQIGADDGDAEADEREHVRRQMGAHEDRGDGRLDPCPPRLAECCAAHEASPRSSPSRARKWVSTSRLSVQITSRPTRRVATTPAALRR